MPGCGVICLHGRRENVPAIHDQPSRSMKPILGMDYGIRRVGFAVSDDTQVLAFPLRVVTVTSDEETMAALQDAYEETGAGLVVIGLPLNMDGTRGPMAERVQRFAGRVETKLGMRVATSDERLSTSLVERFLVEADTSRARRKRVRDKLAAQVILQGYLDAQQHGTGIDEAAP